MSAAENTPVKFPEGFTWGVATASYQIEGAFDADGRGESVWDRFSKTPGKVVNGDTGDRACDHYHLMASDVDLMKELGVGAYRFSVAWPRIQPTGQGPALAKGLDFYSRLVDRLLEKGITPYATLYHWDLPQALEDQGGWPNRDLGERFAEYASLVGRALGDRLKNFMTFNEPWCVVHLGYEMGIHAPGRKEGQKTVLAATHSLLRAHGLAVQALRQAVPDSQVGIVFNPDSPTPATDSDEDRKAVALKWEERNGRWTDPIFLGSYPQRALDGWGADAPDVKPGDMDTIKQPLDFLGINLYSRSIVSLDPDSKPWGYKDQPIPQGAPVTDMGWEIYPDCLRLALESHHERYGNAVPKGFAYYVTENGAAFAGEAKPGGDGLVHDQARVDYLRDHMRQTHQVLAKGVPLQGYFVWSFMDNYEWAEGYTKRFGITHVDYGTLKRTPKDSFRWYQEVIRSSSV